MRVALGTLEVEDDARKAIRKELGGKGHATRGEVKDFLLAALNDDVIPNIGVSNQSQAEAPLTSPGEAGTLPEPDTSGSPHTVATAPAATSPYQPSGSTV